MLPSKSPQGLKLSYLLLLHLYNSSSVLSRCQFFPIKIPPSYFTDIKKLITNLYREVKDQNSQNDIEE